MLQQTRPNLNRVPEPFNPVLPSEFMVTQCDLQTVLTLRGYLDHARVNFTMSGGIYPHFQGTQNVKAGFDALANSHWPEMLSAVRDALKKAGYTRFGTPDGGYKDL